MDYSKQWFERLFKDNYPLMYRMAFSMVENADDAKDAVNQVFTQMWKGKPKVSDSQLRGYLLAATRNQCLHILRQRQLRRQMEEALQRDEVACRDEEREELLHELQQIIDDNLTEQDKRYDGLALEYGAKGRVITTFLVDSLGYISDIKVVKLMRMSYDDQRLSQESEEMQQQVKEQIATQLSEESMRMIGLMPRWMPGKMNGKSCNVRYSMPILFP
ncbi:MAG: sigma-70 family RNA polymerase sigma factor [Prevotella sp.]|nr:sigma-70 family RNA polymerase sigma factor [Prevotella sp.]